ncbi:unnamed protein product [Arabis nemorensis]|uniref:Reverse transcriptase zinc-binding domain-containing protein n=1 Tax=Arabis nemorensis TaxID=586526 RepID=A0A565CS39_9BRAS|nr:unnamed protein product [Arabis nemorensis]
MRGWGMHQSCLLCGEVDETRDHLLFACPYSFTVWNWLCSGLLGDRINPNWNITTRSLTCHWRDKHNTMLLKLAFQATVYSVWRERNDRRHNRSPRTALHIAHSIVHIINLRIDSLFPTDDDERSSLRHRWASFSTIPSTPLDLGNYG